MMYITFISYGKLRTIKYVTIDYVSSDPAFSTCETTIATTESAYVACYKRGFVEMFLDFYNDEIGNINFGNRYNYDQKYDFDRKCVLIYFKELDAESRSVLSERSLKIFKDIKFVIYFNDKGWKKFLKLLRENKECCKRS